MVSSGPAFPMIRQYLTRTPIERRLLRRATLVVGFVRAGLWVTSFETIRRHLDSRAVAKPVEPCANAAELAWATQAVARRIPNATCLTQSLALQYLLARAGQPSSLRIGVARDASGFRAHAWVDAGGRIFLSRPQDVAGYAPIASWISGAGRRLS
jgi:hypothetical protein